MAFNTLKQFLVSVILSGTVLSCNSSEETKKSETEQTPQNKKSSQNSENSLTNTSDVTVPSPKVDINIFPKAQAGYKQVVINLTPIKNEENEKIELFVGKEKMVDCNKQFMTGQIEEKDLQGYGYTYYEVKSNGEVASTMMACPDGKTTKQFVHMQTSFLAYNSKLPIIIYVPSAMDVRYKIWSAGTEFMRP